MNSKKELLRLVKFTLFSISAGIIQIVAFTLLNEITFFKELIKSEYGVPYLIALILSVLWNFTLNRSFTFKSAANVPIAMLKVFGFYLIFTPLSTWLGVLAEDAGVNEYLVLAVTMLCNFVLEFLFCKFFVYRGKEDTLKRDKK